MLLLGKEILYQEGSHVVAAAAAIKLLQLCLILCNPTDGTPPGFPVPGILQARILEWVAISFSGDVATSSHLWIVSGTSFRMEKIV